MHKEVVSAVAVITMTYTGTQQREEGTTAGCCGNNGEVQDERDEPTPTSKELPSQNQNKNEQQYCDRLKAYFHAKIREKDAKHKEEIREKDTKINYHDTDASVKKLLNVHQGLPKLRRNTKAESSIKK